MRVVVTCAAGFIGSTLTDRLLAEGHDVIGIDAFTPYYDESTKLDNLASALGHTSFRLVRGDLLDLALPDLLDGAEVVWHLAGQPGVRLSWSDGFTEYDRCNVLATQRLLEAVRTSGTSRIVYSSSSSVYGNAERFPTLETDRPEPFSPYGVTKLAAEHLCVLYAANWGVPTVSLRYFTVYGPRQRPDMATHRLIRSALDGTPFPMYGDGSQERSFTFVDDVVDATLRAGVTPDVQSGAVYNVAGRFSCTLADMIGLVAEAVGVAPNIERRDAAAGDADRTGGDTSLISAKLGWEATTSLVDGVAAQVAHLRSHLGS